MQITCDRSGVFDSPQSSTLANPASWLVDVLTGGESDTGAKVNWRSALGLSAAWACVNKISGIVGQMPLDLYALNKDRTSEEDYTHPAGKLMRNPLEGDIGAFHFRYLLQNHALITGNGRAFIARNGRGEPSAFVPLPADRTYTVTIYSKETDIRQKWHVVNTDDGERLPLPDYDVLHIYKFSWDGYNGVSPLELLRNPLGLGISGDKYAAKFYKQGGTPSFILEAPVGTFREQSKAEEFLRKFNEYHSGLDNAQRVGLLREGIQAKVLGINNRDAQMLENREFSVRDIMRVFGVHMVPGLQDSQSYNTLEQLNRAELLHCYGPWMKVWEQECGRKLLTERERTAETYYFMFDTWQLKQPDAAQEAEMLTKYVNGMIIESNEAREVLGYAPHKDGSGLRNPATTAGTKPGEQPKTPDKPAPDTPDDIPQDSLRVVSAALKPLVNAEVRRVREMAGKARNFIDWCETYYTKHESRLGDAVTQLGGATWIASEYVSHSKYQLLEAAGACQKTELPERIAQTTAAWPARADELAAQICEVSNG